MDFETRLSFLDKQCQMYQMLLRNIASLADVAPRELLQQQLQELEKAMAGGCVTVAPTEPSMAHYFPKTTTGYVYVLRLEGDAGHDHHFYVGFTQDLTKRLHDHFHGDGAEWTKVHPPVSVMEVFEGDKSDERQKTIAMMKAHGWSTTRGYCWTSKFLKTPPRELET